MYRACVETLFMEAALVQFSADYTKAKEISIDVMRRELAAAREVFALAEDNPELREQTRGSINAILFMLRLSEWPATTQILERLELSLDEMHQDSSNLDFYVGYLESLSIALIIRYVLAQKVV